MDKFKEQKMRMKKIAYIGLVFMVAAGLAFATPLKTVEFVSYIPNDGRMIPATLCLPVGNPGQSFPAVVMLHGTGSARDEAGNGYKMLASYMAERGIASIRIDFAGSGDSKADYVEYTYTSGASDAAAAAEFIKQFKAVDPVRIGIMGWSQGGSVAILAAARYPTFKALLTWAGALDMFDFFKAIYPDAQKNGFAKAAFEWRAPLNLSLQWFNDVKGISLRKELAAFKGPVLAIAGSDDQDVPLGNLDDIVASAGGKDKAKLLIPGADHTFRVFTGDLSKFNELRDATTAWFLKKL
jgi:dipeptidyl aminopeptidase/acylaminoacyl peptidase